MTTTVSTQTASNQSIAGSAALRSLLLVARVAIHRLDEDGMFQQAAALAYYTLFSLLPILAIVLLVTSAIGGATGQGMGSEVQSFFFKQLGLDQIRIVSEGQAGQTDLASYLAARLDAVRDVITSPGTGMIALGTLLWGAISLMMVIERTFCRIYRCAKQRPLFRRLLLYWCILTLGPLCVAASLWLTNNFSSAARSVSAGRVLVAPLSLFAGYFLSFAFFWMIYKLIPETYVSTSAAAWGALVGAFLWEGGKYLFGLYVGHFVGYGKWYGTLGLVPLFMFWIYLIWTFVLLGLEVAYIKQHFGLLCSRLAGTQEAEGAMLDRNAILALGALLAERFSLGRGLSPDQAAEELRMSPNLAERMLLRLQNAGLVHAIVGEQNQYTLSRPAEAITVEELLGVARGMCQPQVAGAGKYGPAHPLHAGISELQKVESDWARTKTLRDLTTPK